MGQILEPLYQLMGAIIAFFYALFPNYAFAICGVTLVVLAVLSPLTWRGLRANIKMQKLMPEMKRLQQEYKDDRVALNEEMMKLYKESNVTPLSGCLPFLVQSPFFIALFGALRGMSRVVYKVPQPGVHFEQWAVARRQKGQPLPADAVAIGAPQYLPEGSAISKSLTGAWFDHPTGLSSDLAAGSGLRNLGHPPGEIRALGFDLARSASEMASEGFFRFLPYLTLMVLMIVLSFLAQQQVNRRNPAAAQANPQLQVINKIFPFLFGIWGWAFQAGVTLYWAASSALRMVQQWALFRFDPHLNASVQENRVKVEEELNSKKGGSGTPKGSGFLGSLVKPSTAGAGPAGSPTSGRNGGPAKPAGVQGGKRPQQGRQQPKKKRKGR